MGHSVFYVCVGRGGAYFVVCYCVGGGGGGIVCVAFGGRWIGHNLWYVSCEMGGP